MDFDEYLVDMYDNVSREEIENIRNSIVPFDKKYFESKVRSLHEDRGDGARSVRLGPLIHVLSVTVQPQPQEEDVVKSLSIYGRISVEFRDPTYRDMVGHDLYKREHTGLEVIGMTGTLTLNGPDNSCWPYNAYIPLFGNKIKVELFDGDNNVFVQKYFSLEDKEIEDGYEHVKSTVVSGERGNLTLHYVAIPLGVVCRIEFLFYNRPGFHKEEQERRFVNVNGKIVASYGSGECTLFEKQSHEFEQVEINRTKYMRLSRYWVALPAYSSLVVGVDLSEFETGRIFLNTTVEFLPQDELYFGHSFVLDDIVIHMRVSRFSPTPLGPCSVDRYMERDEGLSSMSQMPTEQMDIEGKDESSDDDDDDDDDDMSNDDLPSWTLRPHVSRPLPSPAVEIFSVFIGLEKSEAAQIYGSMEISFDDHTVYIFKRSENDALGLSKHMKSTPILDGFRDYEECCSLVMKFDIKDIESRLAIKGYVEWAASTLASELWYDKQLCSLIPGKRGFAAVHYSIFSSAVEANVKVSLKPKLETTDVYPSVYGSLITQYSCYDYSSQYNRDHYRNVLFRRMEDDSIPLNVDWRLPLSRSMIVVPSYSALIINVDLSVAATDQKVTCVEEIVIGKRRKSIETRDWFLHIEVEWCEVKSAIASDSMKID